MKDRFVVGSVTGFPITPGAVTGGKARSFWYVYDSLLCYRIVAEFGPSGQWRARDLAYEMNAEERAWLETLA